MPQSFIESLILAATAATAILIYVWRYRAGKVLESGRTEVVARAAESLGYQFATRPEAVSTFGPVAAGFAFLKKGNQDGDTIRNILIGHEDHQGTYVFDFQIRVGYGMYAHQWDQTVVAIDLQGRSIPDVSILPRGPSTPAPDPFGMDDEIQIHQSPQFARQHRVTGKLESAARAIVTIPSLLAHLTSNPNLSVELQNGWLLYYREHVLIPASELGQFADEAEWILDEIDRSRRI